MLRFSLIEWALVAAAMASAIIFPSFVAAQAQHRAQQPPAADKATNYPFGFRSYGVFRDMITERKYLPAIGLNDAFKTSTDAVGAVSGLRGEISMIEGRPIVSYGSDCSGPYPPVATETASLLATADVKNWRAVAIDKEFDAAAVGLFVRKQAKANGLDASKPFAYRIKGTITDFVMHVNAAPNPRFKGHGSFDSMAVTGLAKGSRLAGYVVGFYAPPAMQGIYTHMGDYFHSHYVDERRESTAHLDAFGVAAGSTLYLPQAK